MEDEMSSYDVFRLQCHIQADAKNQCQIGFVIVR